LLCLRISWRALALRCSEIAIYAKKGCHKSK
jgi:hypothetical protein